jgi:hypothetical protein
MADARQSDEVISENALAREAGNNFSDYAHRGQNHDVDRGMGIEPEQVLEQKRVAAALGIENAQVEGAFENHQHQRDRDDRAFPATG